MEKGFFCLHGGRWNHQGKEESEVIHFTLSLIDTLYLVIIERMKGQLRIEWVRIVLMTVALTVVMGVEGKTASLSQHQLMFKRAEHALAQGKRKQFQLWLRRLGDYPLVPYLQYRYYLKYPDNPDQIAGFLNRYADTRYARPVRASLLKHLAKLKRWRDYIWFYQDLGSTELRCHYAWALDRLGMTDHAWREVQRLWLVGRSQPKACDRVFKAWRQAGKQTRELVWQRFQLALENNKPQLAEYLSRTLGRNDRERARFWLQMHHHPEKKLCRPWPSSFKRDAQIFVHGLLRLARQDLNAAIMLWRQQSSRFNLTVEQEGKVRRFIGLRLAKRHDPRAWGWLVSVPGSKVDMEVHGWQIRTALRSEDWSKVAQAVAGTPALDRRGTQWRYWQARALAQLHGQDAARSLFLEVAQNADFYGFMSADRLHDSYRIPHHPISVPEQAIKNLENSLTVRAIREFLELSRYWEARREWWHLLDQADHQQLLAAAILAQRMDWPQMAIFAVARAEHWDDLEMRFPVRFLDEVRRYSKQRDLDPAYIFGIIRRESAFDEHAHSPVGARGLMQLMPYTARKVARQLRERMRTVGTLEDSATNVRYGTAYFKSLLQRFDGHFVLATAAYNAGPHRVEWWLPQRTLPADIWIETIPFRETRRYVRAVLSYAVIYQKRLEQPTRHISEYASPVPGSGQPVEKSNSLLCGKSS